eukprot:13021773-Ditylum_brightwellii.AAC.1
MTSLPPGTILVPMMPQIQATNTPSQVNNAMVGCILRTQPSRSTSNNDKTTVTLNISDQESNQVRAANFLQLAN